MGPPGGAPFILGPLLLLFLLVQGLVDTLEVFVGSNSIQVSRGENAVLHCNVITSAALTNLNVIWTVTLQSDPDQPRPVLVYQRGQVLSGADQFNGRAGFVMVMPSILVSIYINHTQLSDTGMYRCMVLNIPDSGNRSFGFIRLSVLVPPYHPLCAVQGSPYAGSDIMLTCHSEDGLPKPKYLWEKPNSVRKLPPRARQDMVQGTVVLKNISASHSGLYECVAFNAIGSSTCTLNLQVLAPPQPNLGLIAGAVVAAALMLLAPAVLFIWRTKRKKQEKEISNEIREDALPPERLTYGC